MCGHSRASKKLINGGDRGEVVYNCIDVGHLPCPTNESMTDACLINISLSFSKYSVSGF